MGRFRGHRLYPCGKSRATKGPLAFDNVLAERVVRLPQLRSYEAPPEAAAGDQAPGLVSTPGLYSTFCAWSYEQTDSTEMDSLYGRPDSPSWKTAVCGRCGHYLREAGRREAGTIHYPATHLGSRVGIP